MGISLSYYYEALGRYLDHESATHSCQSIAMQIRLTADGPTGQDLVVWDARGFGIIVILTDHESLKYICDQLELRGRKARWVELMQDFDFEIKYRKGSENRIADALSRIGEVNELRITEIGTDLYNSLRRLCETDAYFGRYWQMVQDGSSIDDDHSLENQLLLYTGARRHFSIRDGLLFRDGKVCVPDVPELKKRILIECHDTLSIGHPEVQRTCDLVRQTFYWPKMKPFI